MKKSNCADDAPSSVGSKGASIMTDRAERIKKRVVVDHYPICIEKFRITLETREETKNDPVIIQRAKILDACARRMPIEIAPDELIVGIAASRPMGLEIDPDYGVWPQDEIDLLKADGFEIDPQDELELQELNRRHQPNTLIGQEGEIYYEDERILRMLKAGLILPPWRDRTDGGGVGGGYAQSGLGLGPSLILLCVDYDKLLQQGTNALIAQAEALRSQVRFHDEASVERWRYYTAVILSLQAMNHLAARCAQLAADKAAAEADPLRKAQADPAAYRDLIVRVAGYSTYFVTLTRAMQDEVIDRTSMQSV